MLKAGSMCVIVVKIPQIGGDGGGGGCSLEEGTGYQFLKVAKSHHQYIKG